MEKTFEKSSIVEFYKGKSIFIAGGTGFVGTAILEKLLFTCDGINKIYLLVKQKKGKSITERVSEMISSEAFKRIREYKQDAIKKIIPINGNLLETSIVDSKDDIKTIHDQVSVVFHVAANVNFNISLSEAIEANTRATKKLIHLCTGMKQLQALVYVSTAYSNCNRDIIGEQVYETGLPIESLFYLVDELGDKISDKIIGGRPNYYTYSKALAEELIANVENYIPAAIVRPSIVLSAKRDPAPGWLDKGNGANNLSVGFGKGFIRCWNGDKRGLLDVIPVDFVSNLSIATAWDVSKRRADGIRKLKVFNCCSGLQNPITVGDVWWTILENCKKHFVRDALIPPFLLIVKNKWLYYILFFFLQTLPAYLFEAFTRLFYRSNGSLRHLHKLLQLRSIEFFAQKQFTFIDHNVRQLYLEMDIDDRDIFNFDTKNIQWNDYIKDYVLGLKKYLLKEGN